MSRHVPKLENDERASDDVVDPTVIAAATRAGEKLHALALSLPAATAYVTPSLIELTTALSIDADGAAAEAHVGHGRLAGGVVAGDPVDPGDDAATWCPGPGS